MRHLGENAIGLREVVFEEVPVAPVKLASPSSPNEQEQPCPIRYLTGLWFEKWMAAILRLAFNHDTCNITLHCI